MELICDSACIRSIVTNAISQICAGRVYGFGLEWNGTTRLGNGCNCGRFRPLTLTLGCRRPLEGYYRLLRLLYLVFQQQRTIIGTKLSPGPYSTMILDLGCAYLV